MSKIGNSANRMKNAREAYVEQLAHGRGIMGSMNRKRDTFTGLNPLDDVDLAYRSTPSYLRQLAQQGSISSNEMLATANVPRTKSASEITPRNNVNRSMSGNPKYKAQEDYYDEIQSMKREMKTIKDENSNLRAKIRRLEEDNVRKRKEIDTLYDSNKDGDLRRTLTGSSTDRSNANNNASNTANVVMSLKQRLFKLESQLKQKEGIIDELKSDPRWTKGTELELQNRALLGEIERQKVERLNYIQKHDYVASVDEEKKTVVRKLTKEKDELKEENDSLKKKIRELEKNHGILSVPSLHDKSISEENEDSKRLKHELDQTNQELKRTQNDLDQVNRDFKRTQTELEQAREKLEQADEKIARMKHDKSQQIETKQTRDALQEKFDEKIKELDQIKRDRDATRDKSNEMSRELGQFKRQLDQTNGELEKIKDDRDRYKKQLEAANREIERLQERSLIDPVVPIRSQSPKADMRSSALDSKAIHRNSSPHDKQLESKLKTIHSKPIDPKPNNGSRPSSPTVAQESALKTVQGSLRGHLARSEINKTDSNNQPTNSDKQPTYKTRPFSKSPTIEYQPSTAPSEASFGAVNDLPRLKDDTFSDSRTSTRDSDVYSKARSSPPLAKKAFTATDPTKSIPSPAPRKSPTSSKQSVKVPDNDDDDDDVIS